MIESKLNRSSQHDRCAGIRFPELVLLARPCRSNHPAFCALCAPPSCVKHHPKTRPPADHLLRGFSGLNGNRKNLRRCFIVVESELQGEPKLITIDEETNHQIVHGGRFGKTNRAPHYSFNSCPEIDMLALDCLHVLFAHFMFLWVDMPPIGTPAIGVKPRNAKRL